MFSHDSTYSHLLLTHNSQPSTVVTLNIPGAVIMPWADAAAAILVAWFPGQEMGHALADILWGDVNPCVTPLPPLTFASLLQRLFTFP